MPTPTWSLWKGAYHTDFFGNMLSPCAQTGVLSIFAHAVAIMAVSGPGT